MVQVHSLIASVVASALFRAGERSSQGDVALGLLAGLRKIRGIIQAQAGHGAACTMDDAIHGIILHKALEAHSQTGTALVPLPPRTLSTHRAEVILEDAALSAVVLNSWFQGNSAIEAAVEVLTRTLLDVLGGAPDWLDVMDHLQCTGDQGTDVDEAEEVVAPAIH